VEGSEESVMDLREVEECLQEDDFPALEPFDISSSLSVTFRERNSLKASMLEQVHSHVSWKAMSFEVVQDMHSKKV
jgi:hypothetical protein